MKSYTTQLKDSYDQQLAAMLTQYNEKLTAYESQMSKEAKDHIRVKERCQKLQALNDVLEKRCEQVESNI